MPNNQIFTKPPLMRAGYAAICGWEYCATSSPAARRPGSGECGDSERVRRDNYEGYRARYENTPNGRRPLGEDAWRPYGDCGPGRPGSYEGSVNSASGGRFGYRYEAFVAEASRRSRIPASWIRAVMKAESSGDVSSTSSKGAMGLMQIIPRTWATLSALYGLGDSPYDPHDNIMAGTAYLREMHDRFGSPGFLAAYNAGPDRCEDHLTAGRALPAETQAYVATVRSRINGTMADGRTPADWRSQMQSRLEVRDDIRRKPSVTILVTLHRNTLRLAPPIS
jgi:hypothetical protein